MDIETKEHAHSFSLADILCQCLKQFHPNRQITALLYYFLKGQHHKIILATICLDTQLYYLTLITSSHKACHVWVLGKWKKCIYSEYRKVALQKLMSNTEGLKVKKSVRLVFRMLPSWPLSKQNIEHLYWKVVLCSANLLTLYFHTLLLENNPQFCSSLKPFAVFLNTFPSQIECIHICAQKTVLTGFAQIRVACFNNPICWLEVHCRS